MDKNTAGSSRSPSPETAEAEELEYLRFFFQEADFGPAHGDVVGFINEDYLSQTGYDSVPEGY